MHKKTLRKSATKWDQNSERAFLEVWSEKMDELRGCRKNSHILADMVVELQARGYDYKLIELKTKMHNMTGRYRREKLQFAKTGAPSEWELYNDMGFLLAQYKTENDIADSINNINSNTSGDPLSPLSSVPSLMTASMVVPPPQPSPSRSGDSLSSAASSATTMKNNIDLNKFYKSFEKNMREIYDDLKNLSERVIAIEEEKKDILKAYVDREAEVQKALIKFLERP